MSEVWNKVVDEIIATMESEERTAFWQAFDDNCLIEHIQSRLASVKNKLDYIPDRYLDDAVNRLAGLKGQTPASREIYTILAARHGKRHRFYHISMWGWNDWWGHAEPVPAPEDPSRCRGVVFPPGWGNVVHFEQCTGSRGSDGLCPKHHRENVNALRREIKRLKPWISGDMAWEWWKETAKK